MKGKKILLAILMLGILIIVVTVALAIYFIGPNRLQQVIQPTPTDQSINDGQLSATVIANQLDTPWAIGFLPNNNLLITERPGQLTELTSNGQPVHQSTIGQVRASGEGGLLGLAIHPDFDNNQWIYVYYTYQHNDQQTLNRVERYHYNQGHLSQSHIILNAIPGAFNHNGGRLAFGPDNYLYITTGDAAEPSLAQDKNSLAGKILRLTDQGQPPQDNPYRDDQSFNSAVYSYGHRNPQGIAWDDHNQLWAVEHGQSATDELNKISRGGNYGWPDSRGDQQQTSHIAPHVHSRTTTWAPSGLSFWRQQLFFSGLRGQTLYSVNHASQNPQTQAHFTQQFGRLRDSIVGPDGALYLTTSNRDGRGLPDQQDDKIIRVTAR